MLQVSPWQFARCFCWSLLAMGLAFCLLATASAASEPRPFDLLTAALHAGGVDDAGEVAACRTRFDRAATKLRMSLATSASERQRIEQVFEFLHRELLVGTYHREVSEVQHALGRGDYNCVSATILFVALCDACGLDAQICGTPEHVFCRFAGPEPLTVEPTCPRWFTQPNPPASHPAARPLTRRQLVAKIPYNRGVLLLQKQQFGPALAELRKSRALDPADDSVRANLLAGLNNGALWHCRHGHFEQAARLLAEAREIDAANGPLQANEAYLQQRWLAATRAADNTAADAAIHTAAQRAMP